MTRVARPLLLVLAALCLFTTACGSDDGTREASSAELKQELANISVLSGATPNEPTENDGSCKTITQTFGFSGAASAVIDHYRTAASDRGWKSVGSLGEGDAANEISFLKDLDGAPLFLQVTSNPNQYTVVLRSTPASGDRC